MAQGTVYPGKSPYPMLPIDACVSTVLANVGGALGVESVPLAESLSRALSCDITAPAPIPALPTSIMDGFAVRAAEGAGRYAVDAVEGATAGGGCLAPLSVGHVRYITTGAPLPEGSDAVVKVEDTEESWEDGALWINISVTSKPGANVRKVGSDTREGELLLRAGTVVGAGEVGLLAAFGHGHVPVIRRPCVAFFSTGDEVVDVHSSSSIDLQRGQIVDCNRPMLQALITESGATPLDLGIVRDEPGALRDALLRGVRDADIVVSSGGVSRGSKDHMKPILEEMGHVHFGEMCMKPGKPTTFATVPSPAEGPDRRPRLVFALPGNPVSCFVTFRLLAVPALQQLSGRPAGAAAYPRVDAVIAQPVEMDPVRPEYHRALARFEEGRIVAHSTGFQRSSRVASVAGANCFLELPNKVGVLPAGTTVKALLLPSAGAGQGSLHADPLGYPHACSAQPVLPPQQLDAGANGNVSGRVPVITDVASTPTTEARCAAICGVLAIGDDGAAAQNEVLDCLQALGHDSSAALQQCLLPPGPGGASGTGVDEAHLALLAGQLREVLRSWTEGSKACNLVVVLGSWGLAAYDAKLAGALQAELHRELPGISDIILRSGLAHSPLAMLTQPVAGVRHGCLVAALPAVAAAASLRGIWPYLAHIDAAVSSAPAA